MEGLSSGSRERIDRGPRLEPQQVLTPPENPVREPGVIEAPKEPRTEPELPMPSADPIKVAEQLSETPEKIEVSVVVNAYNEEAEIGRLLESLKKSWFPGMEVIISDDGSTDSTAAIVKKYIEDNATEKPKNWLVLDSHENLGFSGAKNSGAARARGDYIFFFDSDSPIPAGLLREDLRQMKERGLDIATHYLAAQNKLQSRKTAIKNKLMADLTSFFVSPSTIAGCGGTLIRKSVFDRIGGFVKPSTGIGEDIDLSQRVSKLPGIRAGMIEGVKMPVNMRRFEKHGYVRTLWKYARSWLSLALSEKGYEHRTIGYRPARRNLPISQQESTDS